MLFLLLLVVHAEGAGHVVHLKAKSGKGAVVKPELLTAEHSFERRTAEASGGLSAETLARKTEQPRREACENAVRFQTPV